MNRDGVESEEPGVWWLDHSENVCIQGHSSGQIRIFMLRRSFRQRGDPRVRLDMMGFFLDTTFTSTGVSLARDMYFPPELNIERQLGLPLCHPKHIVQVVDNSRIRTSV